MGVITDVRVRQPAKDDLVGRRFVVAGVGNGFEGTIGIRVLDGRGRVLAEGSAQSSRWHGRRGGVLHPVTVRSPPRDGTRLTVQVFGDNPGLPDEGPSPGFNLREVEVIMFATCGLAALPGRVAATRSPRSCGSCATSRVRRSRRSWPPIRRITDPDVVRVGQRLRIPQKD